MDVVRELIKIAKLLTVYKELVARPIKVKSALSVSVKNDTSRRLQRLFHVEPVDDIELVFTGMVLPSGGDDWDDPRYEPSVEEFKILGATLILRNDAIVELDVSQQRKLMNHIERYEDSLLEQMEESILEEA